MKLYHVSCYMILGSRYSYSIVCWLPPVIPETSQRPSGVKLAGLSAVNGGFNREIQHENHRNTWEDQLKSMDWFKGKSTGNYGFSH